MTIGEAVKTLEELADKIEEQVGDTRISEAIRVVLDAPRALPLQAKILIDHMFLELLLGRGDLEPATEARVRLHLEMTREQFPLCFTGSLEHALVALAQAVKESPPP